MFLDQQGELKTKTEQKITDAQKLLSEGQLTEIQLKGIISKAIEFFKQKVLGFWNALMTKINELIEFKTIRTDINLSVPGLSFCLFNPIYNGKDLKFIDTRWKLKPFQIPYIENELEFKNKLKVKREV